MRHIPTFFAWGLAALLGYIFYLHYQDGNGSQQRVTPRQADVARLQLMDQTYTAQAKRDALRARKR